MNKHFRERRDQVAARHDDALARWPTREGSGFQQALQSVVDELRTIATAADAPGVDRVELSKAYRWLGDACFDLGLGKHKPMLDEGLLAYHRADELLEGADAPIERAKLNFNYGNTLRGLSGGSDVRLLEAAQTRYEAALREFRASHLNELARTVEDALRTIAPQLRLARKQSELRAGMIKLADLQSVIESNAGPEERERVVKELGDLKAQAVAGDPLEVLDEAIQALREVVERHPDRFDAGGGTALAAAEAEAGAVAEAVKQLTPVDDREPRSAEASRLNEIAARIRERLVKDTRAGIVSPSRASTVEAAFSKFQDAAASGGDDLDAMRERTHRMRELTRQFMDNLLEPSWSTPDPPSGSRAHRVAAMLDPLKRFLVAETGKAMLPSDVSAAGTSLLRRTFELESRSRESQQDELALSELERQAWRLAVEIQNHARRDHVMLVAPYFSTASSHSSAHTIFLSGGARIANVSRLIDDFRWLTEARAGDRATARWNQLVDATVAVFDVSEPDKKLRAQVCYELGLAIALGKPTVVVTHHSQSMPFNIRDDFPVLVLDEGVDANADKLRDQIWRSLGCILWGGHDTAAGDGLRQGLAWLDARFPVVLDGTLAIAREAVQRAVSEADPVMFKRSMDQLSGLLGVSGPQLLLPAWPAAYPARNEKPRLFHVTPFRPEWAPKTRDLIAEVCDQRGWVYTRGDESEEQRIMRGIWSEIARASAVVIDLTDFNENVAVELGFVHALGRHHRIVTQGDPEESVFSSLGKMQIHRYSRLPHLAGLAEVVGTLLGTAEQKRRGGV
jgi:nucleoside 2-deoxyribosyltransferase/tetratricopeptide (TPR) repeat protein